MSAGHNGTRSESSEARRHFWNDLQDTYATTQALSVNNFAQRMSARMKSPKQTGKIWATVLLARNRLCASVPNIARSPFSQSFGSKLAIQRRYRERRFFCIPYCYLQGITVRPVPCNYNVMQHISALSRRRHDFLFKIQPRRRLWQTVSRCALPTLRRTSALVTEWSQ